MSTLLVLHGPNLSQLGVRDPSVYGTATLDDVVRVVRAAADSTDLDVEAAASDYEGDLVTRLHAARTDGTAAVIVNAGALTHTSHALADALDILEVPRVEVHLTNIHGRERFRHTSVIARSVDGTIAGLGVNGYALAVGAIVGLIARRDVVARAPQRSHDDGRTDDGV